MMVRIKGNTQLFSVSMVNLTGVTVVKNLNKQAADIVSTPFANSVVNDLLHFLFTVQQRFVSSFSLLP